MRLKIVICLLLAGITLAIYWPVRHYGVIYYDDPLFVTDTAAINSGLNWHSLWWALSGVLVANWHPVTSLSFVLGHQFWGANPGAEHAVNMVFHAANAALLFLVLNRMTSAPWRGAMVAALFAWHPLRVESVAWISERKDVLCGFFCLLTLWAYARFVEESKVQSSKSKFFSRLSLLAFALALMSKPMAVTLPLVLLLLDVWPLQRFKIYDLRFTIVPLIREKIPFFALSAVFCLLTYEIQKNFAAMVSFDRLSLGDRLDHAISGYVNYLGKFFWPSKLAAIYPYTKISNETEIWLAGLLLLAVSALCLVQIARRPYLAVGWFWYLVTMLPVIGLVQVGGQGMADRYTYLPLIGPVISLVWLAAELVHSRKMALSGAAIVVLAGCAALTTRQLQFWHDTVALFEHNISATPENGPAYLNLGVGLERAGDIRRALVCYRVAVAIFPGAADPHRNLGGLLYRQGHYAAAGEEYNVLLALSPDDFTAHLGLADADGHLGRFGDTVFHLNEALRLNPDSSEAMNNLAWLLATCPDTNVRDGARAVQFAERACQLTDDKKTVCIGTLAAAYAEAGRFDEAVATAQKAMALAEKNHEPELLQENRELLELYRAHKAYHEAASPVQPEPPAIVPTSGQD